MKKAISVLLACLMLISCVSVTAFAVVSENDLPFELIPSKTVSMSKVYEDDSTDMNFNYSMESDMIQFMQDCEDSDTKASIMSSLGVEDLYICAQIDWALDDPNGWHHTEYWDDNEATRHYGVGRDDKGRERFCEWDIVSEGVYAQSNNECWITRYAGNPLDPTEPRWNGKDYDEDNLHVNGMKDVLDPSQYTIVEDEPGDGHITIDYNNHTLYARMRYVVTTSTPEYDGEGQVSGYTTNYLFSDWSDTAAYGKDAPTWTPPSADSIKAPAISNLTVSSEEFNDFPIVAYSLTVPEELSKDLTEVTARGGYVNILTEARVKGTNEWTTLQGDWEVKGGILESDILAINGHYKDGTPKKILAGTEIEFRARYSCEIRMEYNSEVVGEFYSPYSDILTVKFTKDYGPEPQQKPDDTTTQTVEKPITSLDTSATQTQVDNYVKKLKNDNDPKGTKFGTLVAKQNKVAKNSIKISWKKVKGAKKYVIYGNKCGKANKYKYLATTTKTSYTQKKLKKGTYYKYIVAAFNKKGKSIAVAKTLHIATKGGKAGNFKKVTTAAKKDKVTLAKKGKTFKLKAKAVPESKKLKVSVHRKIQYECTNTKIASVSAKGVIKAKKKGKCFVYVYAQSGAYKKITVIVKK